MNETSNDGFSQQNRKAAPAQGVDGASSQGARTGPTAVSGKEPDAGLICVAMLAAHYRIAADPFQLSHELALGERKAEAEDLVRAARHLGLKARAYHNQPLSRLSSVPLPAIIRLKDGTFALLAARHPEQSLMRVVKPMSRARADLAPDALAEIWSGEVVLITRRAAGAGISPETFSFTWFLPSIWRYRRPLAHVLAASLFVQLFALVTPLFFQIVIDKVLLHRSFSTLTVIAVGLVIIGLFDVVLQYLRSYALNHTTSRIDVELGARLFDHLLRLPLGYFESRPTGQTVARVRELETIRGFLTGQGLTSSIDLLFTLVFITVLFIYSPTLTLIVVGSIPIYLIIAAMVRPPLREKVKERFNRGAESQQFLVESVVGIQTLKAAAVEPMLRSQWEEKLAAYVKTSFQAVMLSALGQNLILFVNKATLALVLYFGAHAVMSGEMTVGALIAFNMIMNQVTQPILRLSQLWQDFQQVQISIERLGDILNAPTESRRLAPAGLPPAKGAIQISEMVFRYQADGPEVLKGIDLSIPEGQVIGIVGPSGSGKSTLTKLIQRLYRPERGQITVDGIDIGQVDTAWLRRQIGVVLQENILFNRTIHENIALANPGMPRRHVIAVSRLARPHEF
ncbi:MAG: type I secretion system permease/ATPase, partial [Hyphomicrobiaceae bacterium]|nr:type I secretion system permease/ATPase [Hyphomicrobiaceae bacterium]